MKNLESRYSWFSWRWMWAEKLLGYLENFWFFDKNWTKKGWACKMIEWFLETFIRLWGNVIHIGLYKTKIACRAACLGYCLHAVYKINLCSWKWHPVTCKEGGKKMSSAHILRGPSINYVLFLGGRGHILIFCQKIDFVWVKIYGNKGVARDNKNVKKNIMWFMTCPFWKKNKTEIVFCCIAAWIQPDISGCQQDFLVVWRWNQLRTF